MTTEFKFGTWYPIETAPMDATKVLYCYNDLCSPRRIGVELGHFYDSPMFGPCFMFDGGYTTPLGDLCLFSHWMPPPPAPPQPSLSDVDATDARSTSPSGGLAS